MTKSHRRLAACVVIALAGSGAGLAAAQHGTAPPSATRDGEAATGQSSAPRQQPADNQPPPGGPSFADQVIVTANRVEQAIKDVPAAVSVVTREDIRRSGARTIDEVLHQIPGFTNLRQDGSVTAAPSTRTASLRGLGGAAVSRTLVLLDGVPINDPFTSAVYWSMVPLENIERVEIVRSGGAEAWGNLAMGGVINIITAQPETSAVSVTAEAGTIGTRKAHAGGSVSRGALGAAVSGSYFDSDGYQVIPANRRGLVDRTVSDTFRTADARLVYRPSVNRQWSASGGYYDENQGLGTQLSGATLSTAYLRTSADVATDHGGRWQLAAFYNRLSSTGISSTVAPDRNSEVPASNQFDVPSRSAGTSVQWSRPFASVNLFTAGTDLQWITAEAREDFNFVAARNSLTRRRVAGGRQLLQGTFAEHIIQVSKRSRLVAGIRADFWQNTDGHRRETDLQTAVVLRDDTYPDRHGWTFNPSLGIRHVLTSKVSLRGTVYRGFRAPTLNELYRPARAGGNVVIETSQTVTPERLTGVDSGVDVTLGRAVSARVTGFWDELQHPILNVTIAQVGATSQTVAVCGFVAAGGACRQRQNLGAIRSRGLESEIDYRPAATLTLAARYMFNESRVVSAPNQAQLVGKANKGSAAHQFVLKAAYEHRRGLGASLESHYVGGRFEDDLNLLPIGEFLVTNLRASQRIGTQSEGFVEFENVFGRAYEIGKLTDGTPRLGGPRQIRVGLRMHF